MKVQVAFEALAAAISIGLLDQPLDAAVHPLAEGVGHSVDEVVEHLWQMVFDHPGDLLDGVEPAAHGCGVPVLEEGLGLRPVFAFIEGTEDLLQPPGPGRAGFAVFHGRHALGPLGGKVLEAIEPHEAGSLEFLASRRVEQRLLLPANAVHGLVHVLDDMEGVVGDRLISQRQSRARRVDERPPHVHARAADPLKRAGAFKLPVGVQSRLLATVGDEVHERGSLVGDSRHDRHVVVPLADALLVDAHGSRGNRDAAFESSLHRPLLDVVGFLPAQAKVLGRRGGAAMLHQHDRDSLEHGREAPVGLRPRDRDHQRAVLGALHPRDLRLDDRSELARVQMPPAPRRPGVHVHALRARGATPGRLLGLDVDDNLLALHRQIDLRDVPGLLQSEDLFV